MRRFRVFFRSVNVNTDTDVDVDTDVDIILMSSLTSWVDSDVCCVCICLLHTMRIFMPADFLNAAVSQYHRAINIGI